MANPLSWRMEFKDQVEILAAWKTSYFAWISGFLPVVVGADVQLETSRPNTSPWYCCTGALCEHDGIHQITTNWCLSAPLDSLFLQLSVRSPESERSSLRHRYFEEGIWAGSPHNSTLKFLPLSICLLGKLQIALFAEKQGSLCWQWTQPLVAPCWLSSLLMDRINFKRDWVTKMNSVVIFGRVVKQNTTAIKLSRNTRPRTYRKQATSITNQPEIQGGGNEATMNAFLFLREPFL